MCNFRFGLISPHFVYLSMCWVSSKMKRKKVVNIHFICVCVKWHTFIFKCGEDFRFCKFIHIWHLIITYLSYICNVNILIYSFTTSTILSTSISLFWKSFLFLAFQILHMHANQITLTHIANDLLPSISPSNCSKYGRLSFWNAVEIPVHWHVAYHTPENIGH